MKFFPVAATNIILTPQKQLVIPLNNEILDRSLDFKIIKMSKVS